MSECWCQKRSSQSRTPPFVVELTQPSSALASSKQSAYSRFVPAGIFFFFFLTLSDSRMLEKAAVRRLLRRRLGNSSFNLKAVIFSALFSNGESLQRRDWRRQGLRLVSVGCLCGLFFFLFFFFSRKLLMLKVEIVGGEHNMKEAEERLSNRPSFSDNKQHAKPSPVCKHAD